MFPIIAGVINGWVRVGPNLVVGLEISGCRQTVMLSSVNNCMVVKCKLAVHSLFHDVYRSVSGSFPVQIDSDICAYVDRRESCGAGRAAMHLQKSFHGRGGEQSATSQRLRTKASVLATSA